jgi:hypothetical protein
MPPQKDPARISKQQSGAAQEAGPSAEESKCPLPFCLGTTFPDAAQPAEMQQFLDNRQKYR